MNKYYLRPNTIVEPLWNQWYAWPYLIQPATAACITEKMHYRLLKSYVESPQIHDSAVKSGKFKGGAFLDYSGDLENVVSLVERTEDELSDLIGLSKDIALLNTLITEAEGKSLERLYNQVPGSLSGLVELVYDLNHNPSFRIIESLLYETPFYKRSVQSLAMSLADPDGRAFILSSPRFMSESEVHLNIPYDHHLADRLLAMRFSPGSAEEINDIVVACNLDDNQKNIFYELFTSEPPESRQEANFTDEGIRIRYYGHATVLVESKEISILIDPIVSYHVNQGAERFSYNDLPDKIDYVLLTHNHQDHVMFETLLQIKSKVRNIVVPKSSGGALQDPSLRLILRAVGFDNVMDIEEMESVDVVGGRIVGLPFLGEHGDLAINSKLAYFIELEGVTCLFAADSNNLDNRLYERIKTVLPKLDYAFIGMECAGAPMSWLYGPLFNSPIKRGQDQSRRLNGSDSEKALRIIDTFLPREAHIYAMGAEPWLTYISSIDYSDDAIPLVESEKFISGCLQRGIAASRLYGKHEIISCPSATVLNEE